MQDVPSYDDLVAFENTGERHAWGVFGESDQIGTVNHLTPERIKLAAGLVRSGRTIPLTLPLDYHLGMYGDHRGGYKHHFHVRRSGWDDHVDNFALQGSSQWDGLRHSRYREFGYYGGREEEDLTNHGQLGMEHWARHGIIGRGVLIDLAGYMERRGTPLDATAKFSATPNILEEVALAQKVSIDPGDILLLRTGWLSWHKTLTAKEREKLQGTLHPGEGGMDCPGLDAGRDTAAWLWNRNIAAIAGDNPALECLRVDAEVGFQHRRLIAMFGMPIGELWDFDELADECLSDGFYDFMTVSAPLYMPGAAGSPPNAYALK